MRRRIPAIVWTALAGLAGPAAAEAQVTVGFDAGNAPFMYEQAGVAHGLYPALFAEAFRRAGVKVTLEAVPWGRGIAALEATRGCTPRPVPIWTRSRYAARGGRALPGARPARS